MNTSLMVAFVAGILCSCVFLFAIGLFFLFFRPWLQLVLAGGRGSLFQLLAMRLRGTPVRLVVEAYISLLHQGEKVRLADVESQYVAHRYAIRDAQTLMKYVRELQPPQASG